MRRFSLSRKLYNDGTFLVVLLITHRYQYILHFYWPTLQDFIHSAYSLLYDCLQYVQHIYARRVIVTIHYIEGLTLALVVHHMCQADLPHNASRVVDIALYKKYMYIMLSIYNDHNTQYYSSDIHHAVAHV